MGSGSSKKVVRESSLPKKFSRPFPRVIENFVFTDSHNQFVALVCKTNNVAKKFVPSEPEYILPSISKGNKGERFVIVETDVRVNLDLQSGILSEEHKSAERESEDNIHTEEDKTEIINTWELMKGLDDGETYLTDSDTLSFNHGDICQEPRDQSSPTSISRRSKSLESFHTVEEYDAFLARSKRPLWDRNSKRHLYYLGHNHLNKFRSTSLSNLSSCTQLSLQERNMAPIVVDRKDESKNEDGSAIEFPVLQPYFEFRDTKHYVDGQENQDIPQTVLENNSSEENNPIAETVSENSGSQENSQSVETHVGNTDMADGNLEEDQFTETISGKKRMHVRAKLNDLGSITIPSIPEFSAIGSLKEWLMGGGHLYSPGVSTGLPFGYSEFGDKWSKTNGAGNSDQPSSDRAKMETDYSPVLNNDDKLANDGESSVCSDSGVSAIENKQWDYPLFDPELLASFEKALEQLSEEEQYLLTQMDEDSNLLYRKSSAKENEDDLQDSSRTEDTQRQSALLSNDGDFSTQDPSISENF